MKTTIHTNKNIFKETEEYLNEKIKLFNNLTIKIIIDELANNSIIIDKKDIIEKYQQCYDVDKVFDLYDEKYGNELDKLGEKNEMFDDDALLYLILKVVEEKYDTKQLPDKTYISKHINNIMHREMPYNSLLKETNQVVECLNKLKEYEEDNHLSTIFAPYMIDVESFLIRVYDQLSLYNISLDILIIINDLLTELSNNYSLSFRFNEIRINVLSKIARDGDSEYLNDNLNILNKTINDKRFQLYYEVLSGLLEANDKVAINKYYQEIIKYMPINEEQKDMLEIIKDKFK